MTNFSENPQLQLAYDFIESTGENIFLTGKAGTGKTTFLRNLRLISPKRMVVVAPTGVAAINAEGVTIHSFFQMPFGPQIPKDHTLHSPYPGRGQADNNQAPARRMSREKRNIIRSLDLLVIDEISMVRADLLDAVNEVMRRYRDRNKPFGGAQLLMIGDLQQLAPVVREEDRQILRNYYTNFFFFGSRALQEAGFISIELKHIYRQSDIHFVRLLNKIRENKMDDEVTRQLHGRYFPGFSPRDDEGYIILSTHNAQARSINENKLRALKNKPYTFKAMIDGDFPEYAFPTGEELELKTGAQVMFVKNDSSPEKRYYNGKIGKVESIDEDVIFVKCEGEENLIPVETTEWQNMKYSINKQTQEIEETPVGIFVQYPLKLAWAITIHKSQGLTFEKAVIDAQAAFSHGQVYVALSRLKSLEGLILSSPVTGNGIISNSTVCDFNRYVEENAPGNPELVKSKIDYQQKLLRELFDFSLLQSHIIYLIKICRSNAAALLGDPAGALEEVSEKIKKEMIDVSRRFALQVERLNDKTTPVEENSLLQERIRKACVYFHTKIEKEIQPALDNIKYETDNKAVRKSITRGSDQLQQEMAIITECLDICRDGFSVTKFLKVRSVASLEKQGKKKTGKVETNLTSSDIAYPEVFDLIKSWRHEQASEQNIPHYMILTQKALAGLAHFLPSSNDELKRIKGIGKKTIEKYGDQLLNIILSYRQEHNIDIKMPEPQSKAKKNTAPKKNTREISLELFQSGKDISEIAEERGLTYNTIAGHLSNYVGDGTLDINRFMPDEKIKRIAGLFISSGTSSLNPVKEALGNEVTYPELRFVLKHLQHRGKL